MVLRKENRKLTKRRKSRFLIRKGSQYPLKKKVYARIRKGSLQKQINISYDQGYDRGYDQALLNSKLDIAVVPELALQSSFDDGYAKGLYTGGDGIVDISLPGLSILPEISVNEIIAAGIEKMSDKLYNLMGASEVSERLIAALNAGTPLSIIRLGDGELLTLAQEVVYSSEHVSKEGAFLNYAGIQLPDLESRDQLAYAVRTADIVGIPELRLPNFQPLAFSVFRAHGIDYHSLQLTSSTVNYMLYLDGHLTRILAGRRLLIVGNSAPKLASLLTASGFQVVDTIAPVNGMKDIPRVLAEISTRDFELALVGAGIPAVVIAQQIAVQLGKVALDFGHLADSIIKGEAPL